MRITRFLLAVGLALCAAQGFSKAVAPAAGPYKVIKTAKVGGEGGFDFVTADPVGRKLYIPRIDGPNSRVMVYDLDTLTTAGVIATTGARGVAIDPQSSHGFCSSKPVVMWDTKTLQPVKTIDVQGNPDCILLEPLTERIYVLSHRAPDVTVIDAKDGAVVGTIDLGGEPEQGVSDGKGHVYIDLEDKNSVAVVDTRTLKVTADYSLEGKGGAPAGLALDAKRRILFVCGAEPATAVIMNADNGKIITSLPIGSGVDGAVFNPATREAFSSQRDGTLTVIAEKSPTRFEVEQTVQTRPGAKTLTLDAQTNRIVLITADRLKTPTPPAAQGPGGRRGRAPLVPGSFTILVVGR